MCSSAVEGRFVTFLLTIIDLDTNEMSVVNGGHMSPMIRRVDGTIEEFDDDAVGVPVGVLEEYPFEVRRRVIQPGETVMDVGSGGGFDSFIAGQAVGPEGKVIGVDMTEAMLAKSRATAEQMGLDQVEFRHGFAEELPVPDASVDVAISNGVINLCPDKYQAFKEVFRTLKPGGRLYLSDVVVHKPVPESAKANVDLWTA